MRLLGVIAGGVVLAACSAEPIDGGGGGGSGSDAGLDARTDGGGGPVWVDAAIGDGGNNDCEPRVTTYGGGHHNTGQDCLQSCHNHGFTLAGTLYTSPTNNTGFAGATITIRDSNNVTHDVVVQANGNFYTSAAIAFPAVVMASACPYSAKMTATVANGRCNTAACHAQANGAAGQIHLP